MSARRGFAVGASTGLTNSYSAPVALGANTGVDSRASAIPDDCLLGWLAVEIDTIADSAASITWFLALDAAGDNPITDAKTTTIVVGKTTGTDGGFGVALDLDYYRPSTAAQGALYWIAKTNTGTANAKPRLWFREAP